MDATPHTNRKKEVNLADDVTVRYLASKTAGIAETPLPSTSGKAIEKRCRSLRSRWGGR